MTVPAQLQVEFDGGGEDPVEAVLSGEIDYAGAEPMRRQIADALRRLRSRALIVDLSHVQFMDSSGLRALLQLRQQLESADGRLVIAAPTEQVRGVLELTGVKRCLRIADTLPEARMLLAERGD